MTPTTGRVKALSGLSGHHGALIDSRRRSATESHVCNSIERVVEICGVTNDTVAIMATKRPGPGRPSLGERTALKVRLPVDLYEAVRAEAESRGISMNQVVVEIASRSLEHKEALSA